MEKCYLPELNRIIMCSSHNDLRHGTPPKKAQFSILKLKSNSAWYYFSICDTAEALIIQSSFVSIKECLEIYFL